MSPGWRLPLWRFPAMLCSPMPRISKQSSSFLPGLALVVVSWLCYLAQPRRAVGVAILEDSRLNGPGGPGRDPRQRSIAEESLKSRWYLALRRADRSLAAGRRAPRGADRAMTSPSMWWACHPAATVEFLARAVVFLRLVLPGQAGALAVPRARHSSLRMTCSAWWKFLAPWNFWRGWRGGDKP